MYKVLARIFGKYSEMEWAETFEEALEKAKLVHRYGGWLYCRIESPDGHLTQLFFQDDDDPIDDLQLSVVETLAH